MFTNPLLKGAAAAGPKGKPLRKVRVHAKRRPGDKGGSRPKFRTEVKCVAAAPHHKKKSTKHHGSA